MDTSEDLVVKDYSEFKIVVNGVEHTVDTRLLSPETTLNAYLREHLQLTGTKYMCREGGCGVCIVACIIKNPHTGVKETLAFNSCLVSVLSCAGWEIRTVEGVGNRVEGYDPIQEKIVEYNGTQCGFCTPGMVVNMHCLKESGKMKMAEIENSFGGNICRCTGYRPILSAFKSMASDADPKLLGLSTDIEELRLCKKSGNPCKRSCPTPCQTVEEAPLRYDIAPIKNWYKANLLKDVFDIFKLHRKRNASFKLVAGNTARGVYYDMNLADYYIDISSVPELRNFSHDTDKTVLGGNVTLTEMMDHLTQVGKSDENFKHLLTVVDHLDLVATVAIRNAGTIAGNLTMKYVHNEFQSDIFILLEAINAKLIINSDVNTSEAVTPSQYLAVNMSRKVITRIEIPQLGSQYHFQSYKIMPKSQNAHAHVNGAFLFKLNAANVVEEANIVFGAINPKFVHARRSETYIIGKQLFNNVNMQNLFAQLNGELMTDHVLPDPKPEYRKGLAIALLYKAILSLAPASMVTALNKSGATKLMRPVSKGTQEFKPDPSLYPIGKPVVKYEGLDQAAGESKYIIDMPNLPGQLFAAFVMATAAAGSVVLTIDASGALASEGVVAFYQATDLAEMGAKNSFMQPETIGVYEDEKIFCGVNETVQYYFQPIGIVVGTSQRAAERGSFQVKVDYRPPEKNPLLTVRQVLDEKETDRVVHDDTILPTKQTTDVPVKFTGKFDISWQYHYHMETQIVNIQPDDDGGYLVYPASQWMDAIQGGLVGAFKVPANKLSIFIKRIGGAYGAKITRNNWVTCAAMLAVMKLRKPVKFWLPLTTNMNVIGCRNPTSLDYDIGVDANGKIGYLNTVVYSDVGIHYNDLPKDMLIDLMLNTYNPEAVQIEYNWVRTDNHAATWTRAPGSVEGQAMMELIMEHIAYKLDIDPVDVRLANLYRDKHPLMGELFDQFLTWSNYRARRTEIDDFNSKNRWRKRGIAVSTMAYNLYFVGDFHGQVTIYHVDGTVTFTHGGIEIGQGIHTKARQVVAYALGVDMEMISVKPSNNITSPNDNCTGGSLTSEAICFALQHSCDALKQRIDDAANKKELDKNATWLEKVQNAFEQGINLSENDIYSKLNEPSKDYPIYGATATEVEVDLLTGNFIVQRVDLLEDVGDSMSPLIDLGQIEGAYVMGLGYWTSEEIIMDHEGQKMTNRTWTYKPPGCKDIPVDFRVKFPEGIPNPLSPYKTKATAEPPMCMTVSVALAIRHAIKTARITAKPDADPWVPMDGPCTVEWIFEKSLNNFKQYTL